jgi:hypothetical protein
MFCAPELILSGTEGVGSHFNVLRSQTHVRRYRRRPIPFSCFARPNSFSAVPWVSCPVFMFCAPGLVFDGTDGVGSCFNVVCSRTHFRRYRGRRGPFSCFALSDTFSAVPCASSPVFLFCASGLIFKWYQGRRFPFSCFALSDSFSTVPTASGPIFMFCATGLVFDATEGVGSRFHVLCSLTRFQRYRGHQVPFSRFALPESFSAVPRASGPFFMFCPPGLVFGGTEGVGSLFHVLRSRTHFRLY